MIRPFMFLALYGFLWGYLPTSAMEDYRAPAVMLVLCSLATAVTEWAFQAYLAYRRS